MKLSIDFGDLFLFLGKNRRRIKGLCFDGSGLVLFTKRTEKKSFMLLSELDTSRSLTREELKFLMHGSVLRKYSPNDESREVDVVVKEYRRKKHRRFKYCLKASKGTEKEIIVTAKGADKLMPGSHYSAEFAVEVVSDKYIYHMPLERQRRQIEAKGLKVNEDII